MTVVDLDSRRKATGPAPSYPVPVPSAVLPDPETLDCMVAWDTETSSLYTDDGGRTAVVSIAYCTRAEPDRIVGHAFPFDQGRAEAKGFSIQRYKDGTTKADLKDQVRVTDSVPLGFRYVPNPKNPAVGYHRVDLTAWQADVNLPHEEWLCLMRWLVRAGRAVGLAAQNGPFDLHMTRVGTRTGWFGPDLDRVYAYDTQYGSAVLDPLELTGLKPTATRLWGEAEAMEAQEVRDGLIHAKKLYGLRSEDGPRYDLLPWFIVGPYATQDAVLTLRLAKHQTNRLCDGEGSFYEIDRMHDLARACYRMERRGFGPLNREKTEKVATAIEARIAQLENMMPFDPPTAYQAKAYFFDDLGLRPWKGAEEHRVIEWVNTKRGRTKKVVKQGSLGIDIALRMADQGVPFAGHFAELMRLKTANQMHYRGYLNLAGDDGMLRTVFRIAHVKSGRMSVERFQAQAIPRRDSIRLLPLPDGRVLPHPRDLFDTPEGRVRCNLDLSQAELRVAFQFSRCKRGIEQILDGRDIHGEMTTRVYGYQPEHSEFGHYRYFAKRGVFGGIFMVGPKTLQDTIWNLAQIELPFAECKKIVYGFREMYPEIEKAYQEAEQFVTVNGYMPLVDGTRSWFGPRDWPRTAWNRRVQGSLALFNVHWLTQVEAMTEHLEALKLTVHDSVVLDLPIDQAEEQCERIRVWTEAEFERWFGIPGKVDIEIGGW